MAKTEIELKLVFHEREAMAYMYGIAQRYAQVCHVVEVLGFLDRGNIMTDLLRDSLPESLRHLPVKDLREQYRSWKSLKFDLEHEYQRFNVYPRKDPNE